MTNTCIDCIHKDVCYKYRLNYVIAREGTCSDYVTVDLRSAYDRGKKEGYKQAILDGKTNFSRGECKSCRHRDPEDKKCDCGALERQGCYFPVSDDYYCKYYEEADDD